MLAAAACYWSSSTALDLHMKKEYEQFVQFVVGREDSEEKKRDIESF